MNVPTMGAKVAVINVALPWLRVDHRGDPLPDADWRFHAVLPGGAEVTFNRNATAADVAAYLQRDGVPVVKSDH